MFTALWGLILAKCFILEYWVRSYALPIDSTLYVWLPTLSMAAIATFVLLRLPENESAGSSVLSQLDPKIKRVASYALAAVSLLLLLSWVMESLNTTSLQPYFAVVLGASYFVLWNSQRNGLLLVCSLAWLLGAVLLMRIHPTLSLLVFGCMLILLLALPACLQLAQSWHLRHKIRQPS